MIFETEDGSLINLDNVTAIHRKPATYSTPEKTLVHFTGGLPLEVSKPYSRVRSELFRVTDAVQSER